MYFVSGTEVFNVFDEQSEDFDEYEDEDFDEIDEKELRKKIAKELTEEEKAPQVEDPQVIKDEMFKLFGDLAEEILAMETAMQLKFEKARDESGAVLWPCLPLNMKFD